MNKEEKQAIKTLRSFEPIDLFEGAIYLQALEKLTNLIDKLQKENEEYSKQIDLDYVDDNYIAKQKIKEKIEELSQYYKKEIYPSLYQWSDITITEHYDEMIALLQELLEEEK